MEVIPILDYLGFIFPNHKKLKAIFGEDNEAFMKIVKTGNWQKFRHLARTHRLNVASIIEIFQTDPQIVMTPTASQDPWAQISY